VKSLIDPDFLRESIEAVQRLPVFASGFSKCHTRASFPCDQQDLELLPPLQLPPEPADHQIAVGQAMAKRSTSPVVLEELRKMMTAGCSDYHKD
jgi:hypothetical protein